MSDVLNQLSDAFDQALLERLQSGECTAADMNVIRQRLKDCGINAMPTEENPIGKLVQRIRENNPNLKLHDNLPDVDTEADDAATG